MRATKKNEFKILLVDDRPENLISLEELLIAEGRSFIKAGSGNEALKQVIKNEDIGLILLDVQMPEMDGFEVARILKSNPKTKDISIIFVTALSQHEEYVLKGFEEGAVDYLQKPLDINIVRAKVNVFEQLYRNQRDLKNTLAELNLINKQLEKFVSIVSHDLKSPLSSMIMVLDLLRTNELVQNNAELKDDINMLSQASGHLSDMIVSLLEYSRLSASQQTVEEVNTYELAQQVVEILLPPKNITVVISEHLPVIHTSRIKLQQVLQNLVSNAIKYNNKPEGIIEIGAKDKGPWVEFYVKDNGQGIAESDKERIFMLFATTENTSANDSSTGIGLNLLKVLVEEQGGKLWVDSVKDEGSTFYFEWKKD
ncbi:sensor histidine kinase [Sediminibacterium ginsengisoli]|uniref:histidine kinase n=1 Tax=Sediminibacterium ginsengisoli TaxID=413434 RepID=A0A1T4JZV5_9BACT|nr:hybrid sensor histidine kinase/response regulator [Sediminibacterium ginsengisoli]SJZ35565.1 His Kinase A (phospho-acceptor) domain-containing protein [Sediminibacterium ginsengisoli]